MKPIDPPPVPEGLPKSRKCDCGCRRPVVFYLEEWDLGFGLRCEEKYQKAKLHHGVLEAVFALLNVQESWTPEEVGR